MTLSERDFQRTVIQAAQALGWRVCHSRPARMGSGKWATPIQGNRGAPDLLLARGGDVILAELKTDIGKLSADQEAWGRELGGLFVVWTPRDWAKVEARLKRTKRECAA